jgi:hypothetical protein
MRAPFFCKTNSAAFDRSWIPACAGMNGVKNCCVVQSRLGTRREAIPKQCFVADVVRNIAETHASTSESRLRDRYVADPAHARDDYCAIYFVVNRPAFAPREIDGKTMQFNRAHG